MEKKCIHCGAPLPQEADFCLKCFSPQTKPTTPAAVSDQAPKKTHTHRIQKWKTAPKAFLFWRTKRTRILACTAMLFVTCGICFLAVQAANRNTAPAVLQTTQVPVTQENGEFVTDAAGEIVTETVEITTEAQGFFEKLFHPSESSEEDTSQSGGFWDRLFGNTEETAPQGDNTAGTDVSADKDNTTDETESAPTAPSTPTEAPTELPTESQPEEPIVAPPADSAKWKWTELNGAVKLTKYTGNDSIVTVPAYIDGKHVSYLGENLFANNSKIQKIQFEGTTDDSGMLYLPYNTAVFSDLPNLTSITLPYATSAYMVNTAGEKAYYYSFHKLITGCPKLSSVSFTERQNPNLSYNGRMFTNGGAVYEDISNTLVYYPPGRTDKQCTIASYARSIAGHAFQDNPYLESVVFSKRFSSVSATRVNFLGCTNLSSFSVADGNTEYYAKDGVLYCKIASVISNGVKYYDVFWYPPGKKDSVFVTPADTHLVFSGIAFCGNPYLTTLQFSESCRIDKTIVTGEAAPSSLRCIRIKNDGSIADIRDLNDIQAKCTIEYYA